MKRQRRCVILVALVCLPAVALSQIPGIPGASTDLIGTLGKAMGGATTTQSEGAAGAIFGLAKSRLTTDDFSKVSAAVPNMDGLLKAAPPVTEPVAPSGLDSLGSSFKKLGLKPEMVSKAVPVVVQYTSKSGGVEVGKLLSGVLK